MDISTRVFQVYRKTRTLLFPYLLFLLDFNCARITWCAFLLHYGLRMMAVPQRSGVMQILLIVIHRLENLAGRRVLLAGMGSTKFSRNDRCGLAFPALSISGWA